VSQRDLSVVVFGASGITGRGVASYLASRAEDSDFRWAVAGRDAAKLAQVLGDVGCTPPETLVADVGDHASLAAMAARTQVVLDLVGPYTLRGRPVIEACIDNGAHYMDLTGEISFVRRMIDAFHDRAAEAGVKIVQVSGFEALPFDLCVLLAVETSRERWGEALAEADAVVTVQQPEGRIAVGDIISGGTLQSLAEALGDENASDLTDSAALIPDSEVAAEVRRVSPISVAPRAGARGDAIAPMSPGPFINPPVIQRTAYLLAAGNGDRPAPFRYREGMAIPGDTATLPLRYAAAGALGGVQGSIALLSRAQPGIRVRAASLLRRFLPSSGFGPTGARLDEWSWQLGVDARTSGGHYVRVDLEADGQPGYLTTARLLGEAGLLLSEKGATPERGGCLTPAVALGTGSLDRFKLAGMRFSVTS
jgi:short subunit dehydrogenase-like uncharacterized protein